MIEHLQMVQQTRMKDIQRQAEKWRQVQQLSRKHNHPRLLNWLTGLL